MVGHHSRQGGKTNDEQGPGRGRTRVLAEQIDQGWHGQDRPAATEGAETEADEEAGGNGQRDHEEGFPEG
jgi:hypothetical protein